MSWLASTARKKPPRKALKSYAAPAQSPRATHPFVRRDADPEESSSEEEAEAMDESFVPKHDVKVNKRSPRGWTHPRSRPTEGITTLFCNQWAHRDLCLAKSETHAHPWKPMHTRGHVTGIAWVYTHLVVYTSGFGLVSLSVVSCAKLIEIVVVVRSKDTHKISGH